MVREKPIGIPVAPLRDFLKANEGLASTSLLITNHGRYLHATVYANGDGQAASDSFRFLRLRSRLDKMLRTYRRQAKNENITISLDCSSHFTLANFKESKSIQLQEIVWIDDIDKKHNQPVTFEVFSSIVSNQSIRSVLTETTILTDVDSFRATLVFTDEALGENPPEVRHFLIPKNQKLLKLVLELLKEKTYSSFFRVDIALFKDFILAKLPKSTLPTDDDIPF
jgi:hypothetical protein